MSTNDVLTYLMAMRSFPTDNKLRTNIVKHCATVLGELTLPTDGESIRINDSFESKVRKEVFAELKKMRSAHLVTAVVMRNFLQFVELVSFDTDKVLLQTLLRTVYLDNTLPDDKMTGVFYQMVLADVRNSLNKRDATAGAVTASALRSIVFTYLSLVADDSMVDSFEIYLKFSDAFSIEQKRAGEASIYWSPK